MSCRWHAACPTVASHRGARSPRYFWRNQEKPWGGNAMTTRRDFLKSGAAAATGIMFCSCGLLKSAHGQQPTRQKLPVMVGGKQVKTIDVHAHCQFHEAGALLGDEAAKIQVPPVNRAEEVFIDIERRLAIMDSQAIDMEVLSINPFWYRRDRDLAAQIVKIQTRSWPSSAPPSPIASQASPR